jgi:hypothetical protein
MSPSIYEWYLVTDVLHCLMEAIPSAELFPTPTIYRDHKDIPFAPIPSAEDFPLPTVRLYATSVASGHPIDASTFAAWKMEEAEGGSGCADVSGNTRNLTLVAGTFAPTDGIIFDKGRSRYFDGLTRYEGAGDSNWVAFWKGVWTAELWVMIGDNNTASVDLLSYQADNNLVTLSLVYTAGDYYGKVLWQHGAGVSSSFTTTKPIIKADLARDRYHLSFRKYEVSGSYYVNIFCNGQVKESSGVLVNADGAGTGTFSLGGVTHPYFGRIDDVRLSSIPRTDEEIYASYARGLGGAAITFVTVEGI